ncbi:EpsG family protein [Helicobacter himalayensis]|uniref:EpsG family protein n=1 Tax=Helicobacter himalayensis TaxID=1591088 RepID=UPI003D6F6686
MIGGGALFDYGKGVEILLPLFWSLLAYCLGDISCVSFSILNTAGAMLLLLVWLQRYGTKGYSNQEASICIALVFLMIDYFLPHWLIRQFFSSIFLLFALSTHNRFKIFFFLLLAFLCHTSAIVFFILFYMIRNYPKISVLVVIFLIALFVGRNFLSLIFSYSSLFPDFLSHKVAYYEGLFSSFNVMSLRYGVYTFLLVGFGIFYFHKIDFQWRWIIVLCAPLLLSSVFVAENMFIRLGLLYYYVILGFLFFLVLRSNIVMLYAWSFVIFFDKIRTYITGRIENKVNFYPITGDWFYFLLQ